MNMNSVHWVTQNAFSEFFRLYFDTLTRSKWDGNRPGSDPNEDQGITDYQRRALERLVESFFGEKAAIAVTSCFDQRFGKFFLKPNKSMQEALMDACFR